MSQQNPPPQGQPSFQGPPSYPASPYPGQPAPAQPYPGHPQYPGEHHQAQVQYSGQPPIVWYPHADRPSELPVVPREYHEFYRTPRLRWWHPLVALLGFGFAWLVAVLLVSLAALFYDIAVGSYAFVDLTAADIPITPALFLANNVGLALAIPLALGIQRLVFKQRGGWLFSIAGRLRWGLLGRFMLVTLVLYVVLIAVELLTGGVPTDLSVRPETWFLLVSILLTTPLQSAGEEVALRGLLARSIGAWFPASRVGLVVSTAVTSAVFMVLHGAGDPWLNLQYVCFGVVASVLVWKTGGLEAPIALHVVNNLIGLSVVPFTGLDGLFDREAGVGSPLVLVQVVVLVAAAAGMLWQARRLGLPTSAAPAAPAGTVDAHEPPGSRPAWG
ncbi:MAG: type II CAAX endopeptidase family protein [Propionicimonas sp.]|nr:type II CAAX endopeptidase family protein [Propionicimonas sp.]